MEKDSLGWVSTLVQTAKPFTDGLLGGNKPAAAAPKPVAAPAAKTNLTPFYIGGAILAVVIVLVFVMKGRKSA